MKVSDNEILAAIWREQVRRSAQGVVDNYIGGRKGLKEATSQYFAQSVHVMAREKWGLPISYGHLRRRIVSAVEASDLPWVVRSEFSHIWLNSTRAMEVFDAARAYWSSLGVPSGYCHAKGGMLTAAVDDFDDHVKRLELVLFDRFSDWSPEQHEPIK